MRGTLLIIDDKQDKIQNLKDALHNLSAKIEVVSIKMPSLIGQNQVPLDTFKEASFEYKRFYDDVFENLEIAIRNLSFVHLVVLDLNLVDDDVEHLKHLLKYYQNRLKQGELLSNLMGYSTPHFIVWSNHDLSATNERQDWEETLMKHGVDEIFDQSRGNSDVATIAKFIKGRLEQLEEKKRRIVDKASDSIRRNLEIRPKVMFFADIERFTGLFEEFRHAPEVVAQLVDEILRICGEAILRFQGVIHKYIGDCTMAFFPQKEIQYFNTDFDQAIIGSILSAIQIAKELELRKKDTNSLFYRHKPNNELFVNIGIAAGPTNLWGTFGHSNFKEYTVLGPAVNMAARLEGVAVHGRIVLDEVVGMVLSRKYGVRTISNGGSDIPWPWDKVKDYPLDGHKQKSTPSLSMQNLRVWSSNQTAEKLLKELKNCKNNGQYPLVYIKAEVKIGGIPEEKNFYAIYPEFWPGDTLQWEQNFKWRG